jgi:glycosyltransferase involved in cell wall biosynthesis
MIIGYDAKRIVRNGTGLGNYCRTLINALAPLANDDELLLYAPDAGRDDLRRQVNSADNVRFVYPEGNKSRLQRDLWRQHGIVSDLQRDRVSLFHGLTGELPRGIRKTGIRTVVTIHDLIFLRHPEYYHWIDAQIYKYKFRQTLREADRIIAISECTKRDILEFGHYPADRIDVVYQSCSTRFRTPLSPARAEAVSARYGLPDHFILNVGTVEERKNILLAVQALERLPESLHLVVVGRPTPYMEKVNAYIRKAQLQARVHFFANVGNDDLPAFYQRADGFVYPSRYEGFGIPIIEAIQSGLPVVAATGSCLEEAGGPDCLYVSPDNPENLADALTQMLPGAEFRAERIARSQQYIRQFENADVAHRMLEEYGAIMKN